MRLSIHAVGRLKSGPARQLFDHYLERSRAAGRPLGVTKLDLREYAEDKSSNASQRKKHEATQIIEATKGQCLIALDENGKDIGSAEFAELLRTLIERGEGEIAIAIGGPDGHGEAVSGSASHSIRFGRMTWPHQLVRIMLAEQIYRACTILSGHPYHRA